MVFLTARPVKILFQVRACLCGLGEDFMGKGTSAEKMCSSDWPAGDAVGYFLD